MSEKTGENGHFGAAYTLDSAQATLDHYRKWAATYDKEVGEDNGYAQPARATEMLERFQPDKTIRILDAGCGSGLSGLALRAAGYNNLTGCDFSPDMLAQAQEKAVYQSLFQTDLNMGLPDEAALPFDAITCVGVISFGHVNPDACDHLLAALRSGGHLIIALNDPFWRKGDLKRKLSWLETKGTVKVLAKEFGEHLPGAGVMGWVLALEKV